MPQKTAETSKNVNAFRYNIRNYPSWRQEAPYEKKKKNSPNRVSRTPGETYRKVLTAFTTGASLANLVVRHPGLESLLSNHPTACLSMLVNAITRRRIISFSEAYVRNHVCDFNFLGILFSIIHPPTEEKGQLFFFSIFTHLTHYGYTGRHAQQDEHERPKTRFPFQRFAFQRQRLSKAE